MQFTMPAITIGWLLALVVLLLCIVFAAIGRLEVVLAILIGGVALSRLV
jgi:hypothetical protein